METNTGKPATVDEYIAQYPQDLQQILSRIRAVIKETAPDAVERISYGTPGYFLKGGLVWFAANKRHIGLYPWTPGMETSLEGLTPYKGTKGSIHFPLDKPIPYDLIRKIVMYRVEETRKENTPA